MAVGAKILSCVCKEGSDGRGAISPKRKGRTSASHRCFTLGSVEGFQLHLVVWERGCLGGSKHILGKQIRLWAVKTAGELWLVKEAAFPLSVWGVPRADVLVGPAGLVWSSPVCLCRGWSTLARSQQQGSATHIKQAILRKCHLSRSMSRPQTKSAGKD